MGISRKYNSLLSNYLTASNIGEDDVLPVAANHACRSMSSANQLGIGRLSQILFQEIYLPLRKRREVLTNAVGRTSSMTSDPSSKERLHPALQPWTKAVASGTNFPICHSPLISLDDATQPQHEATRGPVPLSARSLYEVLEGDAQQERTQGRRVSRRRITRPTRR